MSEGRRLTAWIIVELQEGASDGVGVCISTAGAQQVLLAVLAPLGHQNLVVAVGKHLVGGCGGWCSCLDN